VSLEYGFSRTSSELNICQFLRDPNGFLDQYQGTAVILDEIQYVPDLLPYIKIRIDRNADST